MVDEVGFIGLGSMGGHMVRHLLRHGIRVHVCDTNPAAVSTAVASGAVAHGTPAGVADHADIVLVCLPTPDIVKHVALGPDGIIQGKRARIYADHSTTGPTVAREVGEKLAALQIAVLDAPLAGGVAGAEAGTLSVMVSGAAWAFDRVRPAFSTFGRNVVQVGTEVGQGQILKLINNMIVGATLIASAEAILFGAKSGLDPKVILDMVNVSTGRSFTSEHILTKNILSRNFDFGFRLELMRKDLRLCLQEAEAAGIPMMTCSAAKQIYDLAFHRSGGADDMSNVVRQLEEWSGATIG